MAGRFTILLVALVALGFAVAGCGDDDDDSAGDNTTSDQATAQDTAGDAASGVPATPQVKRAIEQCKQQANVNQLTEKAREKVREVCEEAGSGDADGAIKATREACEIIVEDSVPPGSAKQSALAACRQSTTTP